MGEQAGEKTQIRSQDGFALGGDATPMAPRPPHFAARAKRVIYLHMAGSPSQLDLFDHKPLLNRLDGQPVSEELIENERFAFIEGVPKVLGFTSKRLIL